MRHPLVVLLAALLSAAASWAQVANGDFEADDADMWKRFGSGVTMRRVAAPGWTRLGSKFNSGEYSRIRLYLRIQTGIGTVCFDSAEITGLLLENTGFEDAEGDRIIGWQQDNVGETISISDESTLEGNRCLCLHHERGAMSRVWQDLECVPNTEYEASVWMRTSRFRGSAYAEIYGIEDGQIDRIIWQTRHLTGAGESTLKRTILQLTSEGGGPGGLEQTLEVEPDRNLTLASDMAAPLLSDGGLSVGVWSGDSLLDEVRLDRPEGQWRTLRTVFQSPDDGIVTIRIEGRGRIGLAYIDNIAITSPGATLAVARTQFVSAERNLALAPVLYARLPDPAPDLLIKGLKILGDRFSEATEGVVSVEWGEGEPQVTIAIDEGEPSGVGGHSADESYMLSCSESGVHIAASTERGAFYGLMALTDLVDRTPDGEWQLIAARLVDAPELPFRGTYMAGLPRDRSERLAWCERLAALRLNAIVIEDDIWWRLDNEEERKVAQEAFSDFRAYGIDPIPELQSFGWAHIILAIDPMVAEGTWVERERLTLNGEEPTALAHPNVLRTDAARIDIENAQGIAYAEGGDYEVIDGVTKHVYKPEAPPYQIRRLPDSRIPDGGAVYASYDYVSRVNAHNCPYCPSEPRVAKIMTAAIRNTMRHLSPSAIHIGHDEPAVMNSDSRCRARHKTNAELLAEDVWRLYEAAREVDPNVDLMMWADAVNPYHNGLQFARDPTADALALLPDDIILNVWFYGPEQPLKEGAESLRFLAAQGYATTGSPWYDETCAVGWAQACRESRLRGEECLGVLYTSWGGRWEALETCAKSAWRPPRRAAESDEDDGGER